MFATLARLTSRAQAMSFWRKPEAASALIASTIGEFS